MATNNAIISIYKRANDVKSKQTISLDIFLDYIREGKYQDKVLHIRTLDEDGRKEAKKHLPNVTISGQFVERYDKDITAHSGFIATDLDGLEDPEETKSLVCCDEHVYAAFVSVSGRGLCVLFKINGDKHREHFAALSEYLYNTYRVITDPTGINSSRARFVSYDPHIYINHKAKKFTKLPTHKPPKKIDKIIFAQNDFDQLINEVVRRRLNIVENYYEWLRVGFALSNKFNEAGRDYFHLLSQFGSKYDYKDADMQYSNCLKAHGEKETTISTLYYYLKNAGLSLYSQETKTIAHAAHHGKMGGLSQAQVIQNLTKFDDIPAEVSTELVAQVFDNNIELKGEDTLLDEVEQWIRYNYDLQRNEITRYIEDKGVILKQKDFNTMFIQAKKLFDKLDYQLFERLINSDFVHTYNPIKLFFDKHIDRNPVGTIDRLFDTVQTDDGAALKYYGMRWIVGIISSIYGQHSPLMLVFSGNIQGTGKTEFFRRLLPAELRAYYAESKLDAGKDDEILMTQKVIIVDDEMGGKSKKDERRLKELLSRQSFSLREPYGRNNVDLERLAALGGTTNDKNILNDPTGNRRILPAYIISIDHNSYNSIDKIDVFMEAYHLWKSGFKWELTKKDIDHLQLVTEQFESHSIEFELISKYYQIPTAGEEEFLTATDIKVFIERTTLQKISLDRIGKELQRMGFEQTSRRIDGAKYPKKVWLVKSVVTVVTSSNHNYGSVTTPNNVDWNAS